MRKFSLGIQIISGLLCLLVTAGCAREQNSGRIVEFTCDSDCAMISCYDFDLGSFNPDGKWVAYASDHSLFSFNFEELHREVLYFHRSSDGDKLDIRLEEDLFLVNGIVRSIVIDDLENSNFREWFHDASIEEIQGVRFLFVTKEFYPHYKSEIEKIQQLNQMLCLEGTNEPEEFISNQFLFLTESVEKLDAFAPLIGKQTKLVVLTDSLDEETATDYMRFFKEQPELRPDRLIVMNTDHVHREFLDLFKDVNTLSYGFFEEDIKSPDLSKFANLEELHISSSSSEMDLAQLPRPEKLRSLSIIGSWSVVKHYEKLVNLEHLVPGDISNEQLKSILPLFPNLVFLNLRESGHIDLNLLTAAPQLEAIIIGEPEKDKTFDPSPLKALKHLRYIGLSESVLNDPDLMKQIREACPQCYIINMETFSICLGSGWLVFVLPLIIIAVLFKRHGQNAA